MPRHSQVARNLPAATIGQLITDSYGASNEGVECQQRQLATGGHQSRVLQVAVANASRDHLAQVAGDGRAKSMQSSDLRLSNGDGHGVRSLRILP